MSTRELRGITPLFQQVLSKQAGKIMDAFSEHRLEDAYTDMQTLIDSLRPQDSDKLLKDGIAQIKTELAKVDKLQGTDLYQTRQIQNTKREAIFQTRLRLLYRKIMRMLHEGGYLEMRRSPVPTNVQGDFFEEQPPPTRMRSH